MAGQPQGGATFNRLEGCWWDDGHVFSVATSGGDAKNGDVNADGFAEGCGQVWRYAGDGDTHPLAPGITDVNRLIGISRAGEAFELAVNRNGSPGSGMTVAITGPWGAGPL
ncbi:MAG TPA: hypothetical protein VFX28_03040 [Methylomirabilota bacterium]|nr:hypothetical protein [Methylomirabilota bacterium]